MIGYKPQKFLITDFKDNTLVELEENVLLLKPVTVHEKKRKQLTLGSKAHSKMVVTGWGLGSFNGSERGTLLKSKKYPLEIEKVHLHIAYNNFDSVVFRLHIRSIKNGLPSEELLNQNIFISVRIKSGWVDYDLKPYNIVMESDFVISIEWIKKFGACHPDNFHNCLKISLALAGGNMFAKEASDGIWQSYKRSPGLYLDCVY